MPMHVDIKRPHVAVYIPTLDGGGAERVAVTLANGFAAAGCRTSLLLVKEGGVYTSDVAPGVEIVKLGGGGVIHALPALTRWLRKERPSAVLSHLRATNVVTIVAAKLAGVKTRLVVSEHSSLGYPRTRWREHALYQIARVLYHLTDKVVAVSTEMQRQIMNWTRLGDDRVTAIYNPIIDDLFETRLNDNAAPVHPWMLENKGPVICSAGRLHPWKRFEVLLDAFAKLRERRADARLVIFGEGSEAASLAERATSLGIGDAVDFAGFWDNPFPSIAKSDLFVLSSQSEGLPSVLVQAMGCGTPVVSTDCPTGPREILEDGQWGRLVPVGDVAALAEAMDHSIADSFPPDVKVRAQTFDADGAIENYLRVLRARSETPACKGIAA